MATHDFRGINGPQDLLDWHNQKAELRETAMQANVAFDALLTRLQASNELLKWLSNIAVMLGETEHGKIAEAIAANDAAIKEARGE